MTHEHLSFQCLNSLKCYTHNDDNRGTTDCHILDTGHEVTGNDRQQGDDAEVNSTKDDDLVDDLLNEFSGGSAGTEAGDETTVLLQVVGNLHGIVLDGGVEPAEEEDHGRRFPGSRRCHP